MSAINCAMTFLLVLFSVTAIGQDSEIQSLALDSCWVKEKESQEAYKLASFNNKLATEIDRDHISYLWSFLQQKINYNEPIQTSEFQTYLHCSSFGAFVVINFKIPGDQQFCLWGKILAEGISLSTMGISDKKEFCHGYREGELFITVKDMDLAHKELAKEPWAAKIDQMENVAENTIKITLNNEYQFEAKEFSQALLERDDFWWLKSADFNFINHPVGEFTELKYLSKKN